MQGTSRGTFDMFFLTGFLTGSAVTRQYARRTRNYDVIALAADIIPAGRMHAQRWCAS
jgi:hypothetical protein